MHARFGCSFVSWAFESETWFLVSNCSCLILAVFTKADHCSSGCSLKPDQCSWHCYWRIVNNAESSACPSFHPSCLFLAFFVFLSIDWLFLRVVSIYRYHVHIYKYCLFCGLPECLLSILNYSYHCLSTLQWPIACSVANLTFSKSLNTYQGVIFEGSICLLLYMGEDFSPLFSFLLPIARSWLCNFTGFSCYLRKCGSEGVHRRIKWSPFISFFDLLIHVSSDLFSLCAIFSS